MQSCSIWSLQETLSHAQAYPLVGPVVFSPIKALISLVQSIIYLLFASIHLLLAACCFLNVNARNDFANGALNSFGCATYALTHLGYSLLNILSLGILGFVVEKPLRNCC